MALALSMSQENNSKLVDVEDEVAKAIIRDITNTADSGNNLNSNYDDDDVEQSDNAKSSQESHSSSKTSVSQNSGSIKLQIEDDDSRSSTSTLKPNPEDEDSRLSSASSSSTIKSSQHSNSSKSDDESDTKKESRTAENKSDNETSRSSFTASSQKSSQQKESQSSQVTSSIAHASENSNSNSSFVKSQATKSSQLSNKDSDDEDSKSTSDVKKSPVKPSQPKKFSSLIDSDSDDDILVTHGSNYNKKQSDSDTCVSKKERLSKLAEKSKQRKRQLLDSDSDTEISTKEKSVKRNKKASGNNSDSNQSSSDNSTSSDDDNDGKQSRLTKNKISNIVDSESDSDNDSRPQFGNNDSTNIDDTDQLLKEKKAKKRTGSARASKDAAMQQIHSETQRLIRESELSLPYHRPKQRTLKEFLNRKKIKASIPQNISCAAKVKMFSHEISKIVDEKEKEAMEFYKSSDSEEEVTNTQPVKEDSSENEKQLDNKQIDEGTCDDDLESNQLVAILTQRLNPDNISEAHNKREILQKRNNDFNVPRKLFLNDVGDNEDNENSLSPENVPNKELSTEEQEIEMDQDLERKVNDDQSKDESSIENNTVLENSTEDIVLNISESEFDTSDVKKLADFSKSCDLTASETVMLAETPCSADKDGNVYQTNALVNMVTQKLNQDYNIQDAPNKRELLQKRGDFKVPKKLLMKDSIDDEEVSKSKLSDTSSKSSETQLENSEEALVLNLSGSELDSSGDKKLGSGSSMEIGSTPNKSKVANLDDDEVSLINEEKTDDGIIDKNALLVENFLPLDFAEDKPKKPSLKEQILAEAMKVKPMLKGCPGMTIDFSSSGKLKEGTEKLLDRFHRHKKLRRRNPEEICEVKVMTTEGSGADLTIVEEILPFKKTIDVDDPSQMEPKPGEKLKKLREDLKRKIAASRCEEWKQKEKRNKEEEEEEMEYSKDKTCNDDYLDDEEILEEEEEESAESEPEENDVPMVDKKRKRCDFGDEEAEESDEGVENYAGVELDNEEDEENDEDEVDEEEEDEEEEEEEEEKEVVHQPKKLKRIIRLDDDDDDDDEDSNSKASVIVSEASNGSNRSEVDGIIPVNRERVGSDARRPNCKTPLPGNSLDTMISPVAHLTALNTSVDSDKKSNSVNKNYFNLGKIEDSPSVDDSFRPPTDSSQKKQNLQKKLFEDPPEAIIDNEVADIISGFTTKTIPSEFTQLNTAVSESQLIDICSGAFSSQADDEKPKCTQLDKICTDDTSQDMILTLDDESCASPIKQTVQEKKEDKKENDKEQEGNSRSYIQKPAVKNPMDAWLQRAKQVQKPETVINDTNNTNYESSKIPPPDKESLGDIEPMNVNNDAQKISEKIVQNSNQTKSQKSDPKKIRKPITEDDGPKSRFMILSSSDEEESNEKKSKKRPKKLLKKKKVQKLELSDDEDEADSDEFSDEEENNDVDEEDEEKYIDYDSDENEVIVVPKKDIKKVARNYVDEEAELSESDWGSADEDENELDEMEVNEADAEDIDEAQVKDQLEKMHMKQVLDEDQREVRLLQELLFEDGDLHSDGKGRERKFKWKNIDKMFDGLSQRPEEDNDEIDDEVDPDLELQMRKIRYEQTKFLEEKEKNMNSVIEEDFSKGQILGKSLKIVNASKMSTTSVNLQDPESAKNNKIFKSVSSSTIKVVSNSKSLSIENWKGSFLSRGDETLTRIAQNLPVKGPLNLKTGRGNFVFKHISPSVASASKEDAENDEEAPNPEPMNRKRKMFASQSSQGQTPRTTKKLKTDERGKAGKKLF